MAKTKDPLAGLDEVDHLPTSRVRFGLALALIALGIAWIIYYYAGVRGDSGGPAFMQKIEGWNYMIGFVALFLGLIISAHPSTPLGRGRGVVVGMLGCFLLGLIWIVVFYVFSQDLSPIWVFNDLNQKNLIVGIAFFAVGFAFATRWE